MLLKTDPPQYSPNSAPQVWSTGLAPTELVSSMAGVEKERGRIKIDGRLRVPGMKGVFAMGDAAVNPDNPLGPLAQVADQQGKVLNSVFYIFNYFYCWIVWWETDADLARSETKRVAANHVEVLENLAHVRNLMQFTISLLVVVILSTMEARGS